MYIGTVLYGYCNGFFGRDSYEDKRIEAIGCDWVVTRGIESGSPDFCSFKDNTEMLSNIGLWSTKPPEEDT